MRLAPSEIIRARQATGKIICLPSTGVARRAGAIGGRPRTILSALVSALTTVAATARARTDANLIMFFVFGERRDLNKTKKLKES